MEDTSERDLLVLGDQARVAVLVVFVNLAGCLGAGLLVRAIAVGFVLRQATSADVDGKLGPFRNFVGSLRIVLDYSSHVIFLT